MAVRIDHACEECSYAIEEYNDGTCFRYVLFNVDEMKQLSELLKGLGF